MKEPRVVLLCEPSLLSEGLLLLLRQTPRITLLGPWPLDAPILERLAEVRPDIVLLAEVEGNGRAEVALTGHIIEQFARVCLVRMGLSDNTLRVFSSRTLPATSAALIEILRCSPPQGELPGEPPLAPKGQ